MIAFVMQYFNWSFISLIVMCTVPDNKKTTLKKQTLVTGFR